MLIAGELAGHLHGAQKLSPFVVSEQDAGRARPNQASQYWTVRLAYALRFA